MESEPHPSAPSSPDTADTHHQLSPGGSALGRLADHAQGLSDDVRSWLELRYELAKIELFERLDDQLDQIILYAIVGGIGLVGSVVLLLATCFAVSWVVSALTGWIIGALFLGFLIVALLFLTLAGIIYATAPRFGVLESKTRATLSEERVMSGRAAGERVNTGQRSSDE